MLGNKKSCGLPANISSFGFKPRPENNFFCLWFTKRQSVKRFLKYRELTHSRFNRIDGGY